MSHACQILTFDVDMDKDAIQQHCDEWANSHCDPYEHGGAFCGLPTMIQFMRGKVYDNLEDARDFLNQSFGSYKELAVRYMEYPAARETKAMSDLSRREMEYVERIAALDKPHYAGVKQGSVKCRECGSVLATRYCGVTYQNNCPVCRKDLRPASMQERRASYEQKMRELQAKYRAAKREQEKKAKSKGKVKWAVACEVHC